MSVLIGIDVGATSISGGLVTPEGEVIAVEQRATHVRGKGTAVETLLELVDAMVNESRARGLHVQGVGVGLPGVVDIQASAMVPFSRSPSTARHGLTQWVAYHIGGKPVQ